MLLMLFLNVRGLYVPAPIAENGFSVVTVAFVIAAIGAVFLRKWAKKRKELTGQPFPVFWGLWVSCSDYH